MNQIVVMLLVSTATASAGVFGPQFLMNPFGIDIVNSAPLPACMVHVFIGRIHLNLRKGSDR